MYMEMAHYYEIRWNKEIIGGLCNIHKAADENFYRRRIT